MQRGKPKENGKNGSPKGVADSETRSQGNSQDYDTSIEKTFVQRAVQVGLITIPLAIYFPWAYRKFFPCPRVKCKPIPKPKPVSKQRRKSRSKTRLPIICSMMEFMTKRYCTSGATKVKREPGGFCKCRHAQKLPREIDPCETLRFDARDDSYDRGASGRSKRPFASFYEDDFRDEINASVQEQAYTGDRYRERRRLPERKGSILKDRDSSTNQQNANPSRTTPLEQEFSPDECEVVEDKPITEQQNAGGHNQQTGQSQLADSTPNTTMTYCEYLKQPILEYNPKDFNQTAADSKESKRSAQPTGKPAAALVLYNAQTQSEDDTCIESITKDEDSVREPKKPQTDSAYNITPEIMDSLCQQYIGDHEIAERKPVEGKERVNLQNVGSRKSDYRKNSDSGNASSKNTRKENERTDADNITELREDGDACNDKYMQEILKRMKRQPFENAQEAGENQVETVDNTKLTSYDDTCDANFHSQNSDTPYIVKDYICKSPEPKKLNSDSGDESDESFEDRQRNFRQRCDQPKGLQKGCHGKSSKENPCD